MYKLSVEEIKDIELMILDWFDSVCKENNIIYYLSGGTLLGAIRHNGFIPWDDDIDLMMLRPEFDRFLDIAAKYENDRFGVESITNGRTVYPFMKIVYKTSLVINRNNTVDNKIWIDVFPMDGLPSNEMQCKIQYGVCWVYKEMFGYATSRLKKERGLLKNLIITLMRPPMKIIGAKTLGNLINKRAQKFSVDKSDYIGVVCWGYGYKERMPKSDWCELVPVAFEKRVMNAPKCWDYYLTSLYGDYMKLPPVEKRRVHGSEAYLI